VEKTVEMVARELGADLPKAVPEEMGAIARPVTGELAEKVDLD